MFLKISSKLSKYRSYNICVKADFVIGWLATVIICTNFYIKTKKPIVLTFKQFELFGVWKFVCLCASF